jgi:predicted dehydrogenase/quercetin dioxygenase-like cupin family protein
VAQKRVIPALQQNADSVLVMVARNDGSQVEEFAKRHNIPGWTERWEDLVTNSEIDAIYIATPVYLHAPQAIAALKAGKHVLCEKPLAINSADAQKMVSTAQEVNKLLGAAYYRRFYPQRAAVAQLLTSGTLGAVQHVQWTVFEDFNADSPRSWLLDPAQAGGGPMMDFGCHRLEVLMSLLGPVETVSGSVSYKKYHRSVEDLAVANLGFKDSLEAVLTIGHRPGIGCDSLMIYCERGTITVPNCNGSTIIVHDGQRERLETCSPIPNTHVPLVNDFVQAVISGSELQVDGQTGLQVTEVLETFYRSASMGSKLWISQPDPPGRPPEPVPTYYFSQDSNMRRNDPEPGLARYIYTGEKLQIVEYQFPPNKVFPPHSHQVEEQMGYLVSGRMGFRIDGVERILEPGDYYHAPVGVVHNAWTFDEPAVLLDFFAPPRDDI